MDKKYETFNTDQVARLKVLKEGMQWMTEKISTMSLKNKDVIVIIGNSRVGKTTLLTALKGVNMKFLAKD
jgi:ABC-type phosphate/phosphonate transport system ATPase subunit